MNKTISVSFNIYKEKTFSSRFLSRFLVMAGILNELEQNYDNYIDVDSLFYEINDTSYPLKWVISEPYTHVLKSKIYEIPSISQHNIAFAINRKEPFFDGYNIKIDRPKTFVDSMETSFEITGLYLNEFILERSFQNIPNDIKDYDAEPTKDPVYDDYQNLTRI